MNESTRISIRRAYPRMDVRIPVRLQQSDGEEPIVGVTLNLSRSGALIRLERPVTTGARHLVQFLEPEPFNIFGTAACESCGAVPTRQVVSEQTLWARALRRGAGASNYTAAFQFENLLEVLDTAA